MNWLSDAFNRILPSKTDGIVMEGDDAWVLDGGEREDAGRDLAGFLTHALDLFPGDSVLYLEGTSVSKEVQVFLEKNKIAAPCRISRASRWPKAQVYHLHFTSELVSGLRERLTGRPPRALCDHLHIHREGKLLCQGFDAGWEPLFVSISIPETTIAMFCEKAGYTYKLEAAI